MEAAVIRTPYYSRKGSSAPLEIHVRQRGSRLILRFPYSPGMVDEVKCMQGRKWDKEAKEWSVDFCDRNLLQLMVLADNPPEWYKRYVEFTQAEVDRVLKEAELVKPIRPACKPHQRLMLAQAIHQRRKLIGAEMGCGKTLTAIELMEHVHARYPDAQMLYVGRGNALEASKLEFSKWKSRLSFRPDLMEFVTFHSLYRHLEAWPEGKAAPRCVILDESQNVKNPAAKVSEAALHLSQAMEKDHPDQNWLLCMSGTPAPNDHLDWWSPCEIVRPGWLRESSHYVLKERLAVYEKVEGPTGSFPRFVKWVDEEVIKLGRRLEGLVYRITRKDAGLDLPDPVYETIRCEPTPEMVRAAHQVILTSNSGLDVLNRLRQLADGVDCQTHQSVEVAKDAVVRSLLDRYEDAGRLGIFAAFTESVDKNVRTCQSNGWDVLRCDGRGLCVLPAEGKQPRYGTPALALEALQSGGEKSDRLAFVGHPEAGGAGLNLQGLSALVFYSNTYKAGERQQAEARPQRLGNKGLTIFDLCCLATDDLVLQKLRGKIDGSSIVLGEIKKAFKLE